MEQGEYEANEAIVELMRDAEDNALSLGAQVADMSMENDQLYTDYCKLYDMMVRISTRITLVETGYSNSDIAVLEIEDIISEIDN